MNYPRCELCDGNQDKISQIIHISSTAHNNINIFSNANKKDNISSRTDNTDNISYLLDETKQDKNMSSHVVVNREAAMVKREVTDITGKYSYITHTHTHTLTHTQIKHQMVKTIL